MRGAKKILFMISGNNSGGARVSMYRPEGKQPELLFQFAGADTQSARQMMRRLHFKRS
jgi:hypothetical protein